MQNAHVAALRDLTAASNSQGDHLQALTQKMHKDSRFVRILTFVALVYLPASLIAVCSATLLFVLHVVLIMQCALGHFLDRYRAAAQANGRWPGVSNFRKQGNLDIFVLQHRLDCCHDLHCLPVEQSSPVGMHAERENRWPLELWGLTH